MEGWTWKALCNEAPFRFREESRFQWNSNPPGHVDASVHCLDSQNFKTIASLYLTRPVWVLPGQKPRRRFLVTWLIFSLCRWPCWFPSEIRDRFFHLLDLLRSKWVKRSWQAVKDIHSLLKKKKKKWQKRNFSILKCKYMAKFAVGSEYY